MERLRDELEAIGAFRGLPVALQVQPETISAMVDNRATVAGAALAELNRLAANSAAGRRDPAQHLRRLRRGRLAGRWRR